MDHDSPPVPDRSQFAALARYMRETRGPWDNLDVPTYNALYCLLAWFGGEEED